MPHLYNTLFNDNACLDNNSDDISMDIINQIHGRTDINCISNYYDINTYNQLPNPDNKLNFMHINSRSLPKNFDNIKAFLNTLSTPPDILAITETWLSVFNRNLFQLNGYHAYHLVRKTRSQGGVSVFVSNSIQSTQIDNLTLVNDNIEILTTNVSANSSSYILCAVYRPHSKYEGIEQFTDNLLELLQTDNIRNKNIILIGDININLLEHTTHIATNNYLATLQTVNFFPHICRPTRFPDNIDLSEPSLLDHIYTNFNNSFTSGILHYQISDHLPIFLNISISSKSQIFHNIKFRLFNHWNKQKFRNKISIINWDNILNNDDVNSNFDAFLSNIKHIYNECFPIVTKTISEKRLNSPWINNDILNAIKTKNRLYKDFKIGLVTELQYKQYRNVLNTTIKQRKKSYYLEKFTNFKNNTRKIWDTVNQLTGSKHKKDNINCINYNHVKYTKDSDIARIFNEFYTNVATNLDNDLPPATIDPLSFLEGDYPTSMIVPPVQPHDVIRVINSLKNKNSNVQELSVSILKLNSQFFALPLSTLFNQSINNGKFPQQLKHATVIPIHKKASKEEIGNYRPISLLSNISKIFEKLMKEFLLNYLETRKIISLSQFGFRSGLNTFDALRTFSEAIYSTLEAKQSLLSIFIDFTKAFDTVNHVILLKKLYHYGIRGIIHDWFHDYLSQRSQCTKIQQHTSDFSTIHYGVPQGSVLGPILFLLYINDLPNIFTSLKTILFADDATLHISGENINNLIFTTNNDLKKLHSWCLSNRMTINLDKTHYMLFTFKNKNNLPPLIYHNNNIRITNTHTLLGVTFDENMSFKSHISNTVLKLSRIVGLFYRVRDFVPSNILKVLYDAHVLPHLQYCTPIRCSTYPTHLLPLFRLQKKIIRIITKQNYFEHTQPLFKSSHILKIFDINLLQIAIYMFKLSHNTSNNILLPQHHYPTRTHDNLIIPLHTLTIFQHSLAYLGPKTWNSLPSHIRSLPTINTFKNHFKKHIISKY